MACARKWYLWHSGTLTAAGATARAARASVGKRSAAVTCRTGPRARRQPALATVTNRVATENSGIYL